MIPRFRLSSPMTRAWALNRDARHKLARWLAHKFGKTGVAVVTDRCFVVAWVNPLAQIKFAVPPFERVERHTCANNPSWRDCECRRWFDPESGSAWGRRQTPEHHPLCIFDPKALRRWREVDLPENVMKQAIDGGFLGGLSVEATRARGRGVYPARHPMLCSLTTIEERKAETSRLEPSPTPALPRL